jgi:hypothetical protein
MKNAGIRVIAQLRTTNLAQSIAFYTQRRGLALDFLYQDSMRGFAQAIRCSTERWPSRGPVHRVRGARRPLPPLPSRPNDVTARGGEGRGRAWKERCDPEELRRGEKERRPGAGGKKRGDSEKKKKEKGASAVEL